MVLRIINCFNILVAGFLGAITCFAPSFSQILILDGDTDPLVTNLLGFFWFALAVTSCLGVLYPILFSPIHFFSFYFSVFFFFCSVGPRIVNKIKIPDTWILYIVYLFIFTVVFELKSLLNYHFEEALIEKVTEIETQESHLIDMSTREN
jgi:hypothetical protein